jgi:pentatricopeptide repeat domain-containing protein 1
MHYTQLIAESHTFDGVQVLGLMEQFGIKPDIVTYSHQLNAFSSLGHMAKCNKVFDRMVEAGVEPDPQVYSILAKGYVRAQQPGKAEELLQRMCRIGVRPNVVTFTTVISGWCSVADMDNATKVYRKMRDAGVRPNLRTFETLIWGYSEQKQPWKAQEVLQMMQEAGVRPKQSTHSLVADAWKAVGLTENGNRAPGSPDDRLRHNANEPDHHSDEDDDGKLQRSGTVNEQARSDHPSHSSFLQVTNALGTGKAGQFASTSPPLQRSCQLQMRSSGFYRNLWQKKGGLYSQGISSFKIMVFLS